MLILNSQATEIENKSHPWSELYRPQRTSSLLKSSKEILGHVAQYVESEEFAPRPGYVRDATPMLFETIYSLIAPETCRDIHANSERLGFKLNTSASCNPISRILKISRMAKAVC